MPSVERVLGVELAGRRAVPSLEEQKKQSCNKNSEAYFLQGGGGSRSSSVSSKANFVTVYIKMIIDF